MVLRPTSKEAQLITSHHLSSWELQKRSKTSDEVLKVTLPLFFVVFVLFLEKSKPDFGTEHTWAVMNQSLRIAMKSCSRPNALFCCLLQRYWNGCSSVVSPSNLTIQDVCHWKLPVRVGLFQSYLRVIWAFLESYLSVLGELCESYLRGLGGSFESYLRVIWPFLEGYVRVLCERSWRVVSELFDRSWRVM